MHYSLNVKGGILTFKPGFESSKIVYNNLYIVICKTLLLIHNSFHASLTFQLASFVRFIFLDFQGNVLFYKGLVLRRILLYFQDKYSSFIRGYLLSTDVISWKLLTNTSLVCLNISKNIFIKVIFVF